MEMEKALLEQVKEAINTSIVESLKGYNSPLTKAVNQAVTEHQEKIKLMASEAIDGLLDSCEFQEQLKKEMQAKLSRVLISSYGGEIERSVNEIKKDVTTRAKIIFAIDNIIKG